MASVQEKAEKDKFFRDLYLLDSLDDDLPDTGSEPQRKPVRKSSRQPNRTLIRSQHEGMKQFSYKGNAHEQSSESGIDIPRPADPRLQKSKSPPPISVHKGNTPPQKRKRTIAAEPKSRPRASEAILGRNTAQSSVKKVRILSPGKVSPANGNGKKSPAKREHVTDLSNIKQRKRQLGSKKLPPVPVEEQMLRGLLFYFVPNNDICPARRFRIHKAIQYGAVWANQWYDDVTHIIVCENLDVNEAAKEFPCKEIPSGPTLVNVNWLIECFSCRVVCETHWNRFQVPGAGALKEARQQVPLASSLPPAEHGTSVASAAPTFPEAVHGGSRWDCHPDWTVDLEETSSGLERDAAEYALLDEDTASEDELDDAIREVRSLGNLPLDLSFDHSAGAPSEDEADADQASVIFKSNAKAGKAKAGFMCMEKHDGGDESNPNMQTIDILLKMAEYYSATGDQWRTRAYRQAVAALRKQSKLIGSKQEALEVHGIGGRIAEKIQEIVSTGRLQRLDNANMDSRDKTLRLFMGIYQVGYPTASRWIAEGHRTLEDLYQKANLNRNQRIGIEHYDDFQQRIPRAEVAQHAAVVKKQLEAADKGLQMIIGGSYRRGSADCGDIDILIFKKDAGLEHIRTLMTETVIPRLTSQGFLKAALASSRHQDAGSKWHGASVLPGSKVWRRIDLLFVPWAELGAALIYFTGNDYFNRSLRLHASRKQMRLNQHGLYADVMRGPGRVRLTDGKLLEGHDEKRIFEILGVTYRPPEHRKP